MNHRPRLEEVFKSSGVPTYTFVQPDEYGKLVQALRTPGRGLVIEGPTGVGKTTSLTKAKEEIGAPNVLMLNARKSEDRDLIAEVLKINDAGVVAIDDFHRLPDDLRAQVADRMKILADEESRGTKLIILGINNAGASLIRFARDLVSRLDIIRIGTSSDRKVNTLVCEGAAVLNADLPVAQIVAYARGSFQIAQVLANQCCALSGILEQKPQRQQMKIDFGGVLTDTTNTMAIAYAEIAMKFCAGPRFNAEGRAPYLHLLKWLSQSKERSIRITELLNTNPDISSSISGVVNGGHLAEHISSDEDFTALLHFDSRNKFLSIEDPKFHFYTSNLDWKEFSSRVGFLDIEFEDKYDFALSFAADRRDEAAYLAEQLRIKDLHVFFDRYEQDQLLAVNIEEYLAPIYKSQATFVICFLSPQYPDRVWTRFESSQFQARFGTASVIPVVWGNVNKPMFDRTSNIGSWPIDDSRPVEPQLDDLALTLAEKIAVTRTRMKSPKPESQHPPH